jgi:hypothetical protein
VFTADCGLTRLPGWIPRTDHRSTCPGSQLICRFHDLDFPSRRRPWTSHLQASSASKQLTQLAQAMAQSASTPDMMLMC